MNYALEHPGFSVRLSAGFVDRRQWMIHGVVEYRLAETGESRLDVETNARRELMFAISRLSSSARSRGARSMYVFVDGDEQFSGFYRLTVR
jgi:hypothetical protein